jgi:hypothetical protein
MIPRETPKDRLLRERQCLSTPSLLVETSCQDPDVEWPQGEAPVTRPLPAATSNSTGHPASPTCLTRCSNKETSPPLSFSVGPCEKNPQICPSGSHRAPILMATLIDRRLASPPYRNAGRSPHIHLHPSVCLAKGLPSLTLLDLVSSPTFLSDHRDSFVSFLPLPPRIFVEAWTSCSSNSFHA